MGKEVSLTKDFSSLCTTREVGPVSCSLLASGFEYFLLFRLDVKYKIALTITIIPSRTNTRSEYIKMSPGNDKTCLSTKVFHIPC